MSYDLLRGFYAGLETVYQTQGFLEEGYALCGVTIVAHPPAQVFEEQAAAQWENFVQDSEMRAQLLRKDDLPKCAIKLFEDSVVMDGPSCTTSFTDEPYQVYGKAGGNVPAPNQQVFNALLRHFLYDLGSDLSLPKGAFWAGP